MFIIPDEYLETRLCDICSKYLSVGPVKTYPDGSTKCGRCQRPDDNGREIGFGLFGERGLFKCVNRFDGCRTLMTLHQVTEHESTCHETKIWCPLCRNDILLPTYMLIKHFIRFHPDNYLAIPTFSVVMKKMLANTYLYRHQDNLFFIRSALPAPFVIGLRSQHLCNEKHREMRLKFDVYFGDNSLNLELKSASCPSKDTSEYLWHIFASPYQQVVQFAFVEFQVYLAKQKLTLVKKGTPFPPKLAVTFPRKLNFYQVVDKLLNITPNETSIVLNNSASERELFMFCFNCKAVEDASNPEFIKVNEKTYYVVCRQCHHYAKNRLNLNITPAWELYTGFEHFHFEFSCIWRSWGCSKYHISDLIADHEFYCSYQPMRKCPVLGCTFDGKLYDIGKHFSDKHPLDNFLIRKQLEIYEAPRSVATNCYVWAVHGFVPIKISPSEEDGYFEVSFVYFDKEEFVNKPRPRILVVVIDKGLPIVIKDELCIPFENGERYQISCYFKVPGQDDVLPVA